MSFFVVGKIAVFMFALGDRLVPTIENDVDLFRKSVMLCLAA